MTPKGVDRHNPTRQRRRTMLENLKPLRVVKVNLTTLGRVGKINPTTLKKRKNPSQNT